jgi:hypothetical protein
MSAGSKARTPAAKGPKPLASLAPCSIRRLQHAFLPLLLDGAVLGANLRPSVGGEARIAAYEETRIEALQQRPRHDRTLFQLGSRSSRVTNGREIEKLERPRGR